MDKETSLPQNQEKKDPIKKGIEVLEFFNHRLRKEMKERKRDR